MDVLLCAIDSNDLSLQLFKGKSGQCEVWQSKSGPDFFDGFYIHDKCDKNLSSHSTLGKRFEGFVDRLALFGTESFTVAEYEVFGIEFVV
jgi:hypothetical protein